MYIDPKLDGSVVVTVDWPSEERGLGNLLQCLNSWSSECVELLDGDVISEAPLMPKRGDLRLVEDRCTPVHIDARKIVVHPYVPPPPPPKFEWIMGVRVEAD